MRVMMSSRADHVGRSPKCLLRRDANDNPYGPPHAENRDALVTLASGAGGGASTIGRRSLPPATVSIAGMSFTGRGRHRLPAADGRDGEHRTGRTPYDVLGRRPEHQAVEGISAMN